jgi:hypothetical protein
MIGTLFYSLWGDFMLHKTDSLIVADSILRLIRADKRLKLIAGIIKPYITNAEHGYTIELFRLNSNCTISFAMETEGRIVVYIGNMALSCLNECFAEKRFFTSEGLFEVRDYIINALTTVEKAYGKFFKNT